MSEERVTEVGPPENEEQREGAQRDGQHDVMGGEQGGRAFPPLTLPRWAASARVGEANGGGLVAFGASHGFAGSERFAGNTPALWGNVCPSPVPHRPRLPRWSYRITGVYDCCIFSVLLHKCAEYSEFVEHRCDPSLLS